MKRSTTSRKSGKRKQPTMPEQEPTKKHGGKRTPSPGKRLGRPPVPPDMRRMHITARVAKDTASRLYSQMVARPELSSIGEVIDDLAARHLPAPTHTHPKALTDAEQPDKPPS